MVGAKDAVWQTESLAAVVELVDKIGNTTTRKQAAEDICNEAARFTGCSSVGLGTWKRSRLPLLALSGAHKIDKSANSTKNYQQTLHESTNREQLGIFPALDEDNNFMLLAHRQLAATVHAEGCLLYTSPSPRDLSTSRMPSSA